jgi:serine/threonine protein kinase
LATKSKQTLLSDFLIDLYLGEGAYSQVFKVKRIGGPNFLSGHSTSASDSASSSGGEGSLRSTPSSSFSCKEEYAMKKVKMGKLTEREKQNALNEVRILASINHPNIIGYKEAFFEESTSSLCIVMEFADGGDLLQMISNHKKAGTFFSEKDIW